MSVSGVARRWHTPNQMLPGIVRARTVPPAGTVDEQLADQQQRLVEAQQRVRRLRCRSESPPPASLNGHCSRPRSQVEQLSAAQRRLHSILGGQVQRRSTAEAFVVEAKTPTQKKGAFGEASGAPALSNRLGRAMAKCAELRELLGVATRRQNETSAELAELRAQLRY